MTPPIPWLLGGIFVGMAVFAVVRSAMGAIAARQVAHLGERLARALELADAAAVKLKERAEGEHDVAVKALHDTLETGMNAPRGRFQPPIPAAPTPRLSPGH